MTPTCPRCNGPMPRATAAVAHLPRRRSRDHILPKERGGKDVIHGDTRNLEVMCQVCNGLRADCFHCWAMVACVRAVAETEGVPERVIRAQWIGPTWPDVVSATARRRVSAQRVAVARAVDRIGLDEFVFPAETAAARVWNLATLRRRYDGPVP